ncbi:MAG: agmatine deiminase family protein, partial [Planktomarina sp.]
ASATCLPGHLATAAPSGYYIPGEEHPHHCTFMQWPNSRNVYNDRHFLNQTQLIIVDIANMISQFEQVILLADAKHHPKIKPLISDAVTLWDIPTEDLWARDAGPLFQVNAAGEQRVASMNFNGWGGKQVHRHDGQVAARVAQRLGLDFIDTGLVGEPGGVEYDGANTLVAHESSWINPNRNIGTKQEITNLLRRTYQADTVIWAPGVAGHDITDYHIDSLMRFTGPNRGLIQLPDAPTERWSRAMYETYDAVQSAGLDIEVIPEPRTPRITSPDFVASYANYYVCNDAVICAEFGDEETDAIAIDALARHYPGREVIAMNVDPLGELGGGIHCATQQRPAL